jgi:hypothetical protein
MNETKPTENATKESYSAHVRLTEEEHRRLQDDSKLHGKSIPKLLKIVYFKGPRPSPLMSKEDQKVLIGQLGRLGNNVNQIARQVNSGFREGFNDDLEEVQRSFAQLMTFLTSTYGQPRR